MLTNRLRFRSSDNEKDEKVKRDEFQMISLKSIIRCLIIYIRTRIILSLRGKIYEINIKNIEEKLEYEKTFLILKLLFDQYDLEMTNSDDDDWYNIDQVEDENQNLYESLREFLKIDGKEILEPESLETIVQIIENEAEKNNIVIYGANLIMSIKQFGVLIDSKNCFDIAHRFFLLPQIEYYALLFPKYKNLIFDIQKEIIQDNEIYPIRYYNTVQEHFKYCYFDIKTPPFN